MFVSSTNKFLVLSLERKFEISLASILWVIFSPHTGYGHWVGPHLDDGSAKKFKISLAMKPVGNFISQYIHFLSAWGTLF